MFPDVVVLASVVEILEPFKACIGQVFLIFGPADSLVFKQVDDGRHVLRDRVEVVIVHAEVVAADAGNVVGLAWMSDGIAVRQQEALFGQRSEVGW